MSKWNKVWSQELALETLTRVTRTSGAQEFISTMWKVDDHEFNPDEMNKIEKYQDKVLLAIYAFQTKVNALMESDDFTIYIDE